MGWFDGFRQHGQNTWYTEQRSAVIADITLIIIITFCAVLISALIIVVIGARGRDKWTTFLRIAFTLHTGIVILVTTYGQDWQIAHITSLGPYHTEDSGGLYAYITVNVGLRSVNVSMEGTSDNEGDFGNVNYNERFWFVKVHEIEQEFKYAKVRGLPQTILYILEYFSADIGNLRWSRLLRQAGYFAYILNWSSFSCWMVSNILFNFVVYYGAALMSLTGTLMVTSCLVYNSLQPGPQFTIPFEDAFLKFSYGWCFWMTAISGGVTLVTGLTILVLYKQFPDHISKFFLTDSSHLDEIPPPGQDRRHSEGSYSRRPSTLPVMSFENKAYSPERVQDNISTDHHRAESNSEDSVCSLPPIRHRSLGSIDEIGEADEEDSYSDTVSLASSHRMLFMSSKSDSLKNLDCDLKLNVNTVQDNGHDQTTYKSKLTNIKASIEPNSLSSILSANETSVQAKSATQRMTEKRRSITSVGMLDDTMECDLLDEYLKLKDTETLTSCAIIDESKL